MRKGARKPRSRELARSATKPRSADLAESGKPVQAGSNREHDSQRLVHELEVHKLELETQNEELRTTRIELEYGLARYTELFDFAPIGYAVLDPSGLVRAVNYTGASLLGRERGRLMGQPFARFVASRHLASFNS